MLYRNIQNMKTQVIENISPMVHLYPTVQLNYKE